MGTKISFQFQSPQTVNLMTHCTSDTICLPLPRLPANAQRSSHFSSVNCHKNVMHIEFQAAANAREHYRVRLVPIIVQESEVI